ncbi:tyrosine-protein kinase domain-containing protein [Microbacterium tumbae]
MSDTRFGVQFVLTSIRKLWWVALVAAVLGAGGAFASSAMQTPLFRATTSLIFALNQGDSAIDLNQGSAYTQSQMLSFAQLVPSSRVLDPVIDELDLDTTPAELARSIEVTIPQSTVTLRITAITADPERSAELANAVAKHLIEVVQEVAPKDSSGAPSITADVFDDAVPPLYQFTPNKSRDALLGGLLGGLVGLAALLFVGLVDTRVRNDETLARVGGAPVLGVVTKSPLLSSRGIAVAQESLGHTAEEFRRIQSALTYANVSARVRVLLVTSGAPGEGKSTVAVNLAMTLAAAEKSVLLIDADLRRPRAHEHAGIDGSIGLTGVLLNEVDMEIAKKRIAGTDLDVLPSGTVPPNPAEILTSTPMVELIEWASDAYDFVVIDSPPILSVADANLLSPLVDGVILVVDATRTRSATLARSVKSLESGGARILGTVLNRARRDRRESAYYSE